MVVTVYKETVCIACISLLWRRVDVSGQRKKALCVPWPVTALVRFGLNSNEHRQCQGSANTKDTNVAA